MNASKDGDCDIECVLYRECKFSSRAELFNFWARKEKGHQISKAAEYL
jgi:hypothetical protein